MDFRDIKGLSGARYLRKSREDQLAEARGEGETLSKHRKILDELIKKYKLNIVDSFEEIESGESIDYRPEMVDLLKKVETNKYSFVLCMDLDRLGRGGLIDQGIIQKIFKESKTLIITPRKIYDLNNEMDEEWSEFEGFMARRELKVITRRMQNGRIQSAKDGKFVGSKLPYGYDKNSDLKLVPNENAKYVQMIFNWYVHGDVDEKFLGGTKIAKKLNELGVKTSKGKKDWDNSTILAILENEVYLGKIQWKKSIKNSKKHFNHKRDRSEWIEVPNAHEPIISEELFYQAKKIRTQRTNPSNNIKKSIRNPLAGLIICSKCGKKMVMQGNAGKTKRVFMIKCITTNCKTKGSSFKYVESEMLKELKKYLELLKIEEQKIIKERQQSKEIENPYILPIENIKKEIRELELQEEKLDDLLERGLYDEDKYKKRSNIIKKSFKDKKELLKQLLDNNENFLRKKETIPEQIEIITNVLDIYVHSDIEIKNKLLKTILKSIIYFREPDASYKKGLSLKISVLSI